MKRIEEVRPVVMFKSDVLPDVVTQDEGEAQIVAWADAHPIVWRIVTETKSRVFGRNATTYHGYQRGVGGRLALARVRVFREHLETCGPFWQWRARFALEHYNDKGYRGGHFEQWDGTYTRGGAIVDYTPRLLDEAIDRFMAWCDAGPCKFPTVEVRVDGKAARKAG